MRQIGVAGCPDLRQAVAACEHVFVKKVEHFKTISEPCFENTFALTLAVSRETSYCALLPYGSF